MDMEATFEFEKETKNTIRFSEITESNEKPIIGSLYIQKEALDELGYEYGDTVTVDISLS